MYKLRQKEFGRNYILFRGCHNIYNAPLQEYHISLGKTDKWTPQKYYQWDDAERTIGYLNYVMRRIGKYGLLYGTLSQNKFPNYKEKIKNEEDELTEYFLYEMRKEPLPEKEYPPMPMN